jgi:hypothetical protein
MGKIADLFRINLVGGNPLEVLLANFLKSRRGQGKNKVIEALSAHYYSIALADQSDVSPEEVELAAIDCIAKLRNQISYVINYHRLKNGIELSSESLSPFGYTATGSIGTELKSVGRSMGAISAIAERELAVLDIDERNPEEEGTGYDLSIFDE